MWHFFPQTFINTSSMIAFKECSTLESAIVLQIKPACCPQLPIRQKSTESLSSQQQSGEVVKRMLPLPHPSFSSLLQSEAQFCFTQAPIQRIKTGSLKPSLAMSRTHPSYTRLTQYYVGWVS